jgi:hypothetical protein
MGGLGFEISLVYTFAVRTESTAKPLTGNSNQNIREKPNKARARTLKNVWESDMVVAPPQKIKQFGRQIMVTNFLGYNNKNNTPHNSYSTSFLSSQRYITCGCCGRDKQ